MLEQLPGGVEAVVFLEKIGEGGAFGVVGGPTLRFRQGGRFYASGVVFRGGFRLGGGCCCSIS